MVFVSLAVSWWYQRPVPWPALVWPLLWLHSFEVGKKHVDVMGRCFWSAMERAEYWRAESIRQRLRVLKLKERLNNLYGGIRVDS